MATIAASPSWAQGTALSSTATAATDGELAQWGRLYSSRVATGVTDPAAGSFRFSDPARASALFSPGRAARASVAAVAGAGEVTCDPNVDGGTVNNLIAGAVEHGQLSSDFSQSVDAASWLLSAVLSAWDDGREVNLEIDGTSITSSDLPPFVVGGQPGAPSYSSNLSERTAQAINFVAAEAPNLINPDEVARASVAPLVGAPGLGQSLAQRLQDRLHAAAMPGDAVVYAAWFGTYGELPLVAVIFDDAWLLIDATNGSVDGPFTSGSPMNPSRLLSHHLDAGLPTGLQTVDEEGCLVNTAAGWRNTRPPGYTPAAPAPGALPGEPKSLPGHYPEWGPCLNAQTSCTCIKSPGSYTKPPSLPITSRWICTCPVGPGGACPDPPKPNPIGPPPPFPGAGCDCKEQWLY